MLEKVDRRRLEQWFARVLGSRPPVGRRRLRFGRCFGNAWRELKCDFARVVHNQECGKVLASLGDETGKEI